MFDRRVPTLLAPSRTPRVETDDARKAEPATLTLWGQSDDAPSEPTPTPWDETGAAPESQPAPGLTSRGEAEGAQEAGSAPSLTSLGQTNDEPKAGSAAPGFATGTLAETVAVLHAARAALGQVGGQVWASPSAELGELVGLLGALAAGVAAAQVAVVREAATRGVIAESNAANPSGWVLAQSPPATQAKDAVMVARAAIACAQPQWSRLDEAVLAGRVPPALADAVMREFLKLRDSLDQSMHQDVLTALIELAETGHSPRELTRLREQLIATYGQPGELDHQHQRLAARRGMTAFGRDLDGMYHAVLTLDPASHAAIQPVIDALSAPVTSTDENGQPVIDTRSGDQRRLDALVEICGAYQTAGNRVRLGVKTRLMVTMNLTDLQHGTGHGTSDNGDILSPATVRHLACDAGIIPAVLGSDRELLDLGREERLATPAQVIALRHRDQGCSFDGCDRPASWCQSHHIRHWLDGGPTDLSNLALLCQRHHTIVHQHGYTATVTKTGVTWHTRPSSGTPPTHQLTEPSHPNLCSLSTRRG